MTAWDEVKEALGDKFFGWFVSLFLAAMAILILVYCSAGGTSVTPDINVDSAPRAR